MYGTNIAITDFNLFSQNVYKENRNTLQMINKIAPEEFMSILTNTPTDNRSVKASMEASIPPTRATNEVVSYYATVNHGN